MELINISHAESINLEQVTRVIDRGNQIEVFLSDGHNVVIDKETAIDDFRRAANIRA